MQRFITKAWDLAALSALPASVFDIYQDSTGSSNVEFLDYIVCFGVFVVYSLILISVIRASSLFAPSDAYATRITLYLSSIAVETRLQLEAGLQTFFFIFAYTSMMLTTFDDDQEELLEFFNTMCYYFFLFTLIYYLYKYSTHYLSFLEAAKNTSKTTSPVSQALFDGLNIIGFTLRFMVLMIRLNIYDGIDDALDSYYIFMADFEEEEYLSDSFFSLFSSLSFDADLNDDRSFLFEDEMDVSTDLFSIYYII
jgi:hypothetical protein